MAPSAGFFKVGVLGFLVGDLELCAVFVGVERYVIDP